MTALLWPALFIFSLRVVDISLYTLRILMVMRGRKALAWVFAFFQASVYVIALQAIIADLGNWSKTLAYAAGFATGMVAGMAIEERLAIGYSHLRIISAGHGEELAEKLRSAGYAVTEVSARGKDGTVTQLSLGVLRRKVREVDHIVECIDDQAMMTAEEIRPLWRGYWPK